jgi:hypothetical protein
MSTLSERTCTLLVVSLAGELFCGLEHRAGTTPADCLSAAPDDGRLRASLGPGWPCDDPPLGSHRGGIIPRNRCGCLLKSLFSP